MEENKHIVLVDDEEDIRETMAEYLVDHGFRVTALEGGADLRKLVESGVAIDVVTLDITMPGEDGLSLARYLSENTNVGIIMVTASGDTVEKIVGLEMGADDYLPKPIDLRELLARIKALLRRATSQAKVVLPEGDGRELIAFGKCFLDMGAHQLFDEDGTEIRLTAMEFDLLHVFAERPNRVLTRDIILELAHHSDSDPFERSVDIRVARLRRKVENDPGKPTVLKTIRGSGYMFVSDTS